MNKRRKVLTAVTLGIFAAILFFHYYSFGYERPHRSTRIMTVAEKAAAISRGAKVIKASKGGRWVDNGEEFQTIEMEYPGRGLYLSGYSSRHHVVP